MAHDEDSFRIRPGKVRDRGGARIRAGRIGGARGGPTASSAKFNRRSGAPEVTPIGYPGPSCEAAGSTPGAGARKGRRPFPGTGEGGAGTGAGSAPGATGGVKARVVKLNRQGARGGRNCGACSAKPLTRICAISNGTASPRMVEGPGLFGRRGQEDGRAFLDRGRRGPASIPLHRRRGGRRRDGRPARLHPRPDAADGN